MFFSVPSDTKTIVDMVSAEMMKNIGIGLLVLVVIGLAIAIGVVSSQDRNDDDLLRNTTTRKMEVHDAPPPAPVSSVSSSSMTQRLQNVKSAMEESRKYKEGRELLNERPPKKLKGFESDLRDIFNTRPPAADYKYEGSFLIPYTQG